MNRLLGKNIILGVGGGISAYKSAFLTRELTKCGADVQVVMTTGAQAFISSLTFQALSGRPVRRHLLDERAEAGMGHIELARWADAIVIAPATANTLADLIHGRADSLLSAVCLATPAPILLAPAMNQQMWQSAAVQTNIKTARSRGIQLVGPAEGEQACGDVGPGRMAEPLDIIQTLQGIYSHQALSGQRVLITAGPTQEAIDPVRYISNHSSGKMGFALAEAAVAAGARVVLVSGPVNLPTPNGVRRIDVVSAQDMLAACEQDCDIFIAASAVADYRPQQVQPQKIKKSDESLSLALVRNPDILATVAQRKQRPALVIGFAAETENLADNAKEKLTQKNLDMIIANQVGEGLGFHQETNAGMILTGEHKIDLPLMNKSQMAIEIIKAISKQVNTDE